jgi:hypothetical protein
MFAGTRVRAVALNIWRPTCDVEKTKRADVLLQGLLWAVTIGLVRLLLGEL